MKKIGFISFLALAALTLGGVSFAAIKTRNPSIQVDATAHTANFDSYTYSGSYYDGLPANPTEGTSGTLRSSLTSLIHPTSVPVYSGSSGDNTLAKVLQSADEDPTNSSNMIYLYTRNSVTKNAASSWNREHVWPKSLSNGCWEESRAGTDLLHLRPTYNDTNSSRGSLKYGEVSGTSVLTYNSMPYGYKNSSYFMPLDAVKGDVARICMYVWVAYYTEYGNKLPALTNVFQSFDVLMQWHISDKPDVMEGNRNEYAEKKSMQGNRNPFVDHPEYAWKIFGSSCSASVLNAAKEAYPDGGSPISSSEEVISSSEQEIISSSVVSSSSTISTSTAENEYTIDCTKLTQVTTDSTEKVVYSNAPVTFTIDQNGGTPANNYLGGKSSNEHTRTYNKNIVTFATSTGKIDSIKITCTGDGYTSGFTGATWENASASANNAVVTITPASSASSIQGTISATTRFTSIDFYVSAEVISSETSSSESISSFSGEPIISSEETPISSSFSSIISSTSEEDITPALDDNYYVLVTDVSELRENDKIVIANIAEGKALSTTQGGNNRLETDISISGDMLVPTSSVETITLGKSNSNWTLGVSGGYLYAASSSSNYLRTQSTLDDNGKWTITIANSGVATITAQGTNTRNLLRYNKVSKIFSCYASGQNDVYIFKSYINEANLYAQKFLNTYTNCDSSGTSSSINWTAASTAYSSLTSYAKAIFKKGTGSSLTTVDYYKQAISAYDYIVGKYGVSTYSDFMSRNPANLNENSSILGFIDQNNSGIIVVTIGAITLTTLIIFSVIVYKRKEN